MRRSCAAWRKERGAGDGGELGAEAADDLRRRRLLRSSSGLRVMNMLPRVAAPPPPPPKPHDVSTPGSSATMVDELRRASRFMASKEMSCSATMEPPRRPVSCCGKKPLGTMM